MQFIFCLFDGLLVLLSYCYFVV